MKNRSKGFTLIELLVVIAIISLLSSVILAAVKDARNKAKLSSVREMTMSLRNESELYYHDNGNKYVSFGPGNEDNSFSDFFKNNYSQNVGFFKSTVPAQIINQILKTTGGQAYYIIREDSWAISFDTSKIAFENGLIKKVYAAAPAPTTLSGTSYVCIDSSGNTVFKKQSFTTQSQIMTIEEIVLPINKKTAKCL